MNIQELETVKRENLPLKMFILNNKVLGKISETQHNNHNNRFAQTTESSGYTVPDFQKIATAYGIKSVTLNSYDELDRFKSWIDDDSPCLFNIMLPENSFLIPKIKWEEYKIEPELENEVVEQVKKILL